jgi:hypothetical protein
MINRDPRFRSYGCRLAVPALLLGALTWPALSAASPSCTIQPQATTIDSGVEVTWSAQVKDIKGDRRVYRWTFEKGSPGTSDKPKVGVRYATTGTLAVGLEVIDGEGKRAFCGTTVTVNGGVTDPPPDPLTCDPVPADAATAHRDCITEYTGPEVCVACHESEARDMHGSVHYQQGGAFPNLTNVPEDFYAAGERPAHPGP